MAESVVKCLNNAIEAIDRMESVDSDLRDEIKQRLRELANAEGRSDEARIVSMEHALLNAEREAYQAQYATMFIRQAEEKLSGGRFAFNPDDAGSIEGAAENLFKFIAPLFGNRGDQVEGSLTSLLRGELQLLNGRMSKVVRFVSDVRGAIRDSENALDFHAEVVGVDTGNVQAREMAQEFHKNLQPYLERMRKAGVWVDVTKNWFFQSHDWANIKADLDNWRTFMRENLDPEQHPDVDAAVEALENSLARRDFEAETNGRIGMRRVFQFRTPEAQHEYFTKFGQGNVTSNVINAIDRITGQVVAAEQAGPMALRLVQRRAQQIQAAANKLPQTKKTKRAIRLASGASNTTQFIQQPMNDISHATFNNINNTLRMGMSGVVLGKVFLAQLIEDPVNSVLFGRHLAGGVFKAFGERFSSMLEIMGNTGNMRTIAEEYGAYNNVVTASSVSRLAMDMDPRFRTGGGRTASERTAGAATQFATFTQRITGAQRLEQTQRAAMWVSTMRGFTRQTQNTWDELPSAVRDRILVNNGITRQDWATLRKQPVDANKMLDTVQLEKKHPKLYRKYMAMVLRESEVQINLPDLRSRYLLSGIVPPGVPRGLAQQITQFMAWGMSVWRNGFAREIQSGAGGTLMATFGLTVSAAVSLQLYQVASGRPPFEWDSPTLWKRALTRSAAIGPHASMMLDLTDPEFSSGLPGVVPDTLVNLGADLRAGGMDLFEGEADKALSRVAKNAKQIIVPNWWFADGLLNQQFDAIIEELDPQYLRRRNRRWREEGRMGQ